MNLKSPIPFHEALQRNDRAIMPTTLSSRDLVDIEQEILDKSFFSATNFYEDVLQRFKTGIEGLLNVERGLNPAELRTQIKQLYKEIGYAPLPDEARTIQDHSSDARINLVIFMNERDAASYGQFKRNQDPALLFSHPCMELVRFEDRKEKRNWLERWRGVGGKVFSGTGLDGKDGRLIARKDDNIWTAISAFGRPWAPFDFNSGVGLRPVRRKEAIALGVIKAGDQVQPLQVSFQTGNEGGLN